jgi:MFS transporter, DHA1 family, tetracycline resistance protein
VKLRIKPLWIILFTIFIDILGFGILVPVIPLLLADPNSPYFLLPQNFSLAAGYVLLGLLTATFSFMQFLAAPVLGQLSDRWGRKRIIAISLSGTTISYFIFAVGIVTRNIPLLFFSRAFDGITAGSIAASQAAIADITPPEKRVKNYGWMSAAFGLGLIAGPLIGGRLSDPTLVSWFNAATPFWFAGTLSFLNVLSIILFFPETLKVPITLAKVRLFRSINNVVKAFSLRKFKSVFLTVFLYTSGFAFFVTFFSVFLIDKFSFNQRNIGDTFAYLGIWGIITQAVIVGLVAKILNEYRVIKIGTLASGLAILLFFLPLSWPMLLFLIPLFAIFNGLTGTNVTALLSKLASVKTQGRIMGINASVQALSFALPPILSGWIAAGINPSASIAVAAVVVIFSGLFFYSRCRKEPNLLC